MNHIKQVTVFGGSGFIGQAIVRALAPRGYLVRVACRRVELAEKVKTAGDVGQITVMRANLRIPESVAIAVEGSQAVINAAGIAYERGRQRYTAVHGMGARAIAEAARAAGVERLVHVSGIGADSGSSKNRYVRSKVEAEGAIVAAFETATILRPSVVFGPDDVLFNRLARIAALAPFMPVVGSGQARVQPVFVGDVAAAAAAVLARPDTAQKVFELGGPRVYTYRELAALTLREIDRTKPIIGVPAGLMKIAAFFAEFPAMSRAHAADHPRPGRSSAPRQRRAARRAHSRDPGHRADGGGGHFADLPRPLPHRRPLQPARPGLTGATRPQHARLTTARNVVACACRHSHGDVDTPCPLANTPMMAGLEAATTTRARPGSGIFPAPTLARKNSPSACLPRQRT